MPEKLTRGIAPMLPMQPRPVRGFAPVTTAVFSSRVSSARRAFAFPTAVSQSTVSLSASIHMAFVMIASPSGVPREGAAEAKPEYRRVSEIVRYMSVACGSRSSGRK